MDYSAEYQANEYLKPKFSTLSKESIDTSSMLWMENKRKTKNGFYVYKCEIKNKFGQTCRKDNYKIFDMCKQHWAKRGNTLL